MADLRKTNSNRSEPEPDLYPYIMTAVAIASVIAFGLALILPNLDKLNGSENAIFIVGIAILAEPYVLYRIVVIIIRKRAAKRASLDQPN